MQIHTYTHRTLEMPWNDTMETTRWVTEGHSKERTGLRWPEQFLAPLTLAGRKALPILVPFPKERIQILSAHLGILGVSMIHLCWRTGARQLEMTRGAGGSVPLGKEHGPNWVAPQWAQPCACPSTGNRTDESSQQKPLTSAVLRNGEGSRQCLEHLWQERQPHH